MDLGELAKKKKIWEYSKENIKHFDIPKSIKSRIGLKTDKIRGSLEYLFNKHPEMFDGKADIVNIIKDVFNAPDIIKPATRRSGGFIIAKSIDDKKKKMIDIGINPNNGVIFHLNKRSWDADMKKYKKQ